ncbi:SLOG family protein [Salipaludibacillus daqingensis]|uniref:SLOG family protein n=1 Tax=Salipaludibacillus daqingensis TaxID=3041001 RepID=UPI002474AD1E|nr:SLOG family protein [Salipaludibacillus daqingensis]
MYQVLAITGYKPHEIGIFNEQHDQLPFLKKALSKKITQLKEEFDIKWIITSGQPGVELWAAEAAIELKSSYPDLKVATLAPFHNQDERFQEAVKTLYEFVWDHSDYRDYITKRPYDNPAQLRSKNEFIVEKSDASLVLYDSETEGTPKFFLNYALKKQHQKTYPIFYLTPDDLEEMIRDQLDDETWN